MQAEHLRIGDFAATEDAEPNQLPAYRTSLGHKSVPLYRSGETWHQLTARQVEPNLRHDKVSARRLPHFSPNISVHALHVPRKAPFDKP